MVLNINCCGCTSHGSTVDVIYLNKWAPMAIQPQRRKNYITSKYPNLMNNAYTYLGS